MPYCTSCGHQVEDGQRFCRSCGAPQQVPRQPAAGGVGDSLSPRGASILCYVPWLGWIVAVYLLATARFKSERTVRFHAYQGLYLFVVWMLSHWVAGIWVRLIFGRHGFPIGSLIELALLVVWIIMLVKTSAGERYSLPLVGELAERSL